MKYILSGLTFVVGLVLFILFHVATKRDIGGFVSILLFTLIVSATGFVFKKAGGGKAVVNKGPNISGEHSLSKLEIKDFSKVFTADVCKNLYIDAVHISSSTTKHADYVVGLESNDFNKIDISKVQKLLSKRFYDIRRIVLEEYLPDNNRPSYIIQFKS